MGRLLRGFIVVSLSAFLACLANAAESVADAPGAQTPAAPPAELKISNRPVMLFRGVVLGESPETRARRARASIADALDADGDLSVRVDSMRDNFLVLVGYNRAFIVAPQDLEEPDGSAGQLAQEAAANLRLALAESREARNLRFLLAAGAYTGLATLAYALLLRGAGYLKRKTVVALPRLMSRHARAFKLGRTPLFDLQLLYSLIGRLCGLLYWVTVALLTYQWLSFVLSQFPYTRPWGESLKFHLLRLANYLFEGILNAMPGLAVAVCILLIARGIVSFSCHMLTRMARPGTLRWLTEETLKPTTRLTSLAIWLFALVMAYPYLPGSGTDAFKGLSVLIGLMISLGASSVVGQAAAGLILTYSRTLRPGEYVRVGDHEGTVTEVGMFTTSIRTGLGEVLTLPNSMVTGSVTKNYSRIVDGEGYVVDTVVTIGYDTPWRQVEAMLLEAASRTEGIVGTPAPCVFQTALSDFYPEYRLVAQAIPAQPRPRALLLSLLHANIQDVFNEYGVQIMSPHYLADPEQPKWVPKEQWHAQPAKPPSSQV